MSRDPYRNDRYHRQKLIALGMYGGKCVCCGEQDIDFLTIDHIKNDGAKERKMMNNQSGKIYGYLIRHKLQPKKYQILCWNCNLAKEKHKICPHQKRKFLSRARPGSSATILSKQFSKTQIGK